jgi:hypothetical protein
MCVLVLLEFWGHNCQGVNGHYSVASFSTFHTGMFVDEIFYYSHKLYHIARQSGKCNDFATGLILCDQGLTIWPLLKFQQ